MQHLALFLIRIVTRQPLARWAAILILVGQTDEVLVGAVFER
jgi:hypothetical protein